MARDGGTQTEDRTRTKARGRGETRVLELGRGWMVWSGRGFVAEKSLAKNEKKKGGISHPGHAVKDQGTGGRGQKIRE